ncbi:MAG: TlpA disulfide reductase family protein [Planctomycetota bacterium]
MPHLQGLVELHKDNPFALIGINTGDPVDKYRQGLKDFGVTWLSAYQGATSPIAELYKVTGYPTYVLIDAEGKIAGIGHNGKAYDETIAKMVAELKSK